MIILHAAAPDGRIVLWGERSVEPGAKGPWKSRGPAAGLEASRFALDEHGLMEAVAAEVAGFEVADSRIRRWVAWWPTDERLGALPSSPLLVDEEEVSGAAQVRGWETPAINNNQTHKRFDP